MKNLTTRFCISLFISFAVTFFATSNMELDSGVKNARAQEVQKSFWSLTSRIKQNFVNQKSVLVAANEVLADFDGNKDEEFYQKLKSFVVLRQYVINESYYNRDLSPLTLKGEKSEQDQMKSPYLSTYHTKMQSIANTLYANVNLNAVNKLKKNLINYNKYTANVLKAWGLASGSSDESASIIEALRSIDLEEYGVEVTDVISAPTTEELNEFIKLFNNQSVDVSFFEYAHIVVGIFLASVLIACAIVEALFNANISKQVRKLEEIAKRQIEILNQEVAKLSDDVLTQLRDEKVKTFVALSYNKTSLEDQLQEMKDKSVELTEQALKLNEQIKQAKKDKCKNPELINKLEELKKEREELAGKISSAEKAIDQVNNKLVRFAVETDALADDFYKNVEVKVNAEAVQLDSKKAEQRKVIKNLEAGKLTSVLAKQKATKQAEQPLVG